MPVYDHVQSRVFLPTLGTVRHPTVPFLSRARQEHFFNTSSRRILTPRAPADRSFCVELKISRDRAKNRIFQFLIPHRFGV